MYHKTKLDEPLINKYNNITTSSSSSTENNNITSSTENNNKKKKKKIKLRESKELRNMATGGNNYHDIISSKMLG